MTARRLSFVSASLTFVVVTACGSPPSPPVVEVDMPCETTPCISDRWDEPPPQIGQTPPDEPAPEGALDAFEPVPE